LAGQHRERETHREFGQAGAFDPGEAARLHGHRDGQLVCRPARGADDDDASTGADCARMNAAASARRS
jgi:hypothetical protein